MKKDIEQIRQQLLDAKERVKAKKSGCDEIIDDFFDKIEMWWCYPEYMVKPFIYVAVGMTGTGKTSLFRDIANELSMGHRFAEINMSGGSSTDSAANGTYRGTWDDSISGRLSVANIFPRERGILFVDEFQHLRDKDEQGNIIPKRTYEFYEDLWKILSDGRVNDELVRVRFLKDLISSISKAISDPDEEEIEINPELPKEIQARMAFMREKDKKKKAMRLLIDYRYERMFGISDADVEELEKLHFLYSMDPEVYFRNMGYRAMQTVNSESRLNFLSGICLNAQLQFISGKLEKYVASMRDPMEDINVFSNLLIIMAGNIDGAFSNMVEDVAKSQDQKYKTFQELHEASKKVTKSDVKVALTKMFRAERVARLGNNIGIFRNPSETDLKKIIAKEIENFANFINTKHERFITFGKGVVEEIWDSLIELEISPSQGVRPILNQVHSLLGEIIPKYLIEADRTGRKAIEIKSIKD